MTAPLTESWLQENVFPKFSRVLSALKRRDEIYLANHSLGRPPDRTAQDVAEALALWYDRLDGAWGPGGWPDGERRFLDLTAKLVGAAPAGMVSKTSVGQGLRAVLNALPTGRPLQIVATRGEFDSTDFILRTYAEKGRAQVRWVEPESDADGIPVLSAADIRATLRPGDDLLLVSHVFFGTGQVLDGLEELLARARELGIRTVLDTYHSAGVLPMSLDVLDPDVALGGSYKYVRGGPGACWMWLSPRVLADPSLTTLDTGWFAKRDPFAYARPEPPQRGDGANAWRESTPPILAAYQALAGLEVALEVGVARQRAYLLETMDRIRDSLAVAGLTPHRPQDPTRFGGYVLVPHRDPAALTAKLREVGVNVDARGPFVRFGPDILTTSDEIAELPKRVRRVLG